MSLTLRLTKKAFGGEYGLFLETPDRLLYPNPHSHRASENHLGHFEFLGRVIGKAMYEGILVEVPFANFFLYAFTLSAASEFCVAAVMLLAHRLLCIASLCCSAKLLSKFNYYNDLVFLDPELHRNMMILKRYDGNVEEDFALNFTVTDSVFGVMEVSCPVVLIFSVMHASTDHENR
jgi:ubiquitin-protein ligase E3 C